MTIYTVDYFIRRREPGAPFQHGRTAFLSRAVAANSFDFICDRASFGHEPERAVQRVAFREHTLGRVTGELVCSLLASPQPDLSSAAWAKTTKLLRSWNDDKAEVVDHA